MSTVNKSLFGFMQLHIASVRFAFVLKPQSFPLFVLALWTFVLLEAMFSFRDVYEVPLENGDFGGHRLVR